MLLEQTVNLFNRDKSSISRHIKNVLKKKLDNSIFAKTAMLKRKVIVPFITNGIWLGEALDDVKRYAKESTIKDVITIKFNGNTMEDSNKVESWIDSL